MLKTIFYAILFVLIIGTVTLQVVSQPAPIQTTITDAQVNQIYENLVKYTGLSRNMMPTFTIVKDDKIVNAYQDPNNNTIVVYSGMVKFANDQDELAAVISHEIAHYMLEHAKLNPQYIVDYQTILEGNADKFGIYLMLRAGYDPCKAKELWVKLRTISGDYESNTDHPNYSYRIWQFEFPMCGGS